jgi:hypothetical protein
VQVVLLKLPMPLLEKVMEPVGVVAVPPSVSLTVAVQVVALFRLSGLGEQLTDVEVVRVLTVRSKGPLLIACVLSPA